MTTYWSRIFISWQDLMASICAYGLATPIFAFPFLRSTLEN